MSFTALSMSFARNRLPHVLGKIMILFRIRRSEFPAMYGVRPSLEPERHGRLYVRDQDALYAFDIKRQCLT